MRLKLAWCENEWLTGNCSKFTGDMNNGLCSQITVSTTGDDGYLLTFSYAVQHNQQTFLDHEQIAFVPKNPD